MTQKNRLAALFLTMAALLCISLIATYVMGVYVVSSRERISRQLRVLNELQDVLSTVKDAETGQRGFLLTNNPSYLEPYSAAVTHIHAELAQLRRLASEERSIPSDTVDRLDQLINRKLDELKQTIDLRRAGGIDAAMAIVNSDTGKELMDSIREVGSTIENQSRAETQRAEQTGSQLTALRTGIFAGAALLNLAFIGWAFFRIQSESQRRIEANAETARQRDLLGVTLASIGDAVIVTDAAAKITFMNAVAEELTGWPLREAQGTPCADVFNIVNEASRSKVESPVDRVLREGVVVGLANHTVLIRRDKSEIPIDDSGAPIRDAGGTMRGVVLIFRDFTEHKESERKLRDANTSLEAASKAKDQFMAALSHELRTPLTPVLATLSMWEASDELPPALMPDIQMLRRNVELEARLIDDLLDLTRIVKGKMAINLELVDVHHLIHETAEMYASEIRSKRLDLDLSLSAPCHQVTADPARLQQVFWNILKNATKFTPEGGRVSVITSNDADGHIQVRFSDNGIGIDPETLSRLFQPFEQGSSNISRKYGGLGLGLALSKAIVEAQGGRISASSEGPNRGATFIVDMPALAGTSSGPRRSSIEPLSREPHAPANRIRILVVEDHKDTADALSHLLRGMGHEVEARDTVAGALEILGNDSIDLLISDLGLPDGTGIDLLRKAREFFTKPAVVLTGFGMEEDIARCKQAGFAAHLTKPVNFQKMANIVRQYAAK